ncbi:MAG: hypothetical protein JXR37_01565 [Kiritimatiellae bacterium]|nr:hypothetical protein [Kiritimatiellia bacterium]
MRASRSVLVCLLVPLLAAPAARAADPGEAPEKGETFLRRLVIDPDKHNVKTVTKQKIMGRALLDLRQGGSAEAFWRTLGKHEISTKDMATFKTLVVAQWGEAAVREFFGTMDAGTGSTAVEQQVLAHRRRMTLQCIADAVRGVCARQTTRYGYHAYIGYVGKWALPDFPANSYTFAGDIDFSFMSNDKAFARALKQEFDRLIVREMGIDPVRLDSVCTVHGEAASDVYVGAHGKRYGDKEFLKPESIVYEVEPNGNRRRVKGEDAVTTMAAEVDLSQKQPRTFGDVEALEFRNKTEPGLSLEMLRHFVGDITRLVDGHRVYSPLTSIVKAAKYAERSTDALDDALGEEAKDAHKPSEKTRALRRLARELKALEKGEKGRDIGGQVERLRAYFGGDLPIRLECAEGQPARAVRYAHTDAFFMEVEQSIRDNARRGLRAAVDGIEGHIEEVKALRRKDDVASRKQSHLEIDAVQRRIRALADMLELEAKVFAEHSVKFDAEFGRIQAEFVRMTGDFEAQFDLKKIVRSDLKHFESCCKALAKTRNGLKLAAAAVIKLGSEANFYLDCLDDVLLQELREGNRSYNAFDKLAARIPETFKPSQDSIWRRDVTPSWTTHRPKALDYIQAINRQLNADIQDQAKGLSHGLVLYNLSQELPVYVDCLYRGDWQTLGTELFRRRVPFGAAVEYCVMGDYYRMAWDVVVTVVPPLGIPQAIVGIQIALMEKAQNLYWNEQLSVLEDTLYLTAKFRLVAEGVATYGKGADAKRVGRWRLASVRYRGEVLEREDMRQAIIGHWENWHTFRKTIFSADPELAVIREIMRHPAAGKTLQVRMAGKLSEREHALRDWFTDTLVQRLEERMAADYEVVAGRLVDLIEDLRKRVRALDIEREVEAAMVEEGKGFQAGDLLTWAWNWTKRDFFGQGSQEDLATRSARVVLRYLRAYDTVLACRRRAEQAAGLSGQVDDGLRLLTGPPMLSGKADEDVKKARGWLSVQNEVLASMAGKLLAVKRRYVEGAALDSAFDKEMLEKVVRHETWRVAWRDVYKNRDTMKPKALERARHHDTERESLEQRFADYYARQGAGLTVCVRQEIDGRKTDTPVPNAEVYLRYRSGKKVKLEEQTAGDHVCARPAPGHYHLFAWANGFQTRDGAEKLSQPLSIPAAKEGAGPAPLRETVYLAPAGHGSLVVYVVGARHKAPLCDAEVVLVSPGTRAASSRAPGLERARQMRRKPDEVDTQQGKHVFKDLLPGRYRVSASEPFCESRVAGPVLIPAGRSAPAVIRLQLERQVRPVRVTVVDTDGKGLAGAEVALDDLRVKTDAGGTARLAKVPVGTRIPLQVSKTGFRTAQTEVDIMPDPDKKEFSTTVAMVPLRLSVTPQQVAVQPGEKVSFNAACGSPPEPAACNWYLDGRSVSLGASAQFSWTFRKAGSYQIEAKLFAGRPPREVASAASRVTVAAKPDPTPEPKPGPKGRIARIYEGTCRHRADFAGDWGVKATRTYKSEGTTSVYMWTDGTATIRVFTPAISVTAWWPDGRLIFSEPKETTFMPASMEYVCRNGRLDSAMVREYFSDDFDIRYDEAHCWGHVNTAGSPNYTYDREPSKPLGAYTHKARVDWDIPRWKRTYRGRVPFVREFGVPLAQASVTRNRGTCEVEAVLADDGRLDLTATGREMLGVVMNPIWKERGSLSAHGLQHSMGIKDGDWEGRLSRPLPSGTDWDDFEGSGRYTDTAFTGRAQWHIYKKMSGKIVSFEKITVTVDLPRARDAR